MNDEPGDDVSEQNERQPFQNGRDLIIAEPDCRNGNADSEKNDEDVRVDVREHFSRIRHSGKIGADVDRVCSKERYCRDQDQWPRIFVVHGAGETTSADHADASAHHLHESHERPRDQRRP
jgi:hypothetical protein